jgi:hypothetical protein
MGNMSAAVAESFHDGLQMHQVADQHNRRRDTAEFEKVGLVEYCMLWGLYPLS